MFQTLLNFLAEVQQWFSWLFTEVWRQFGVVLKSYWGWCLIFVGWGFTVVKFVDAALQEILARIDSINLPTVTSYVPGGATVSLQFINTFLPLSELLGYIVALMVLRLGLSVYRLIKSWIPTLS